MFSAGLETHFKGIFTVGMGWKLVKDHPKVKEPPGSAQVKRFLIKKQTCSCIF